MYGNVYRHPPTVRIPVPGPAALLYVPPAGGAYILPTTLPNVAAYARPYGGAEWGYLTRGWIGPYLPFPEVIVGPDYFQRPALFRESRAWPNPQVTTAATFATPPVLVFPYPGSKQFGAAYQRPYTGLAEWNVNLRPWFLPFAPTNAAFVFPSPAVMTMTGLVPTVFVTNNKLVNVPVAAMAMTGLVPTVKVGPSTIFTPDPRFYITLRKRRFKITLKV